MRQQVQITQPADQFLSDAAAFFAKRRAQISDRTDRGFRFGLQGGDQRDGGQGTVTPAAGGGSTVTVQADGLGVMAMAEGFVRDLRKQARDAGRQGRSGAGAAGGGGGGGGFADLRQRLGMPAPAPAPAPPRRAPAGDAPEDVPEAPAAASARPAPIPLAAAAGAGEARPEEAAPAVPGGAVESAIAAAAQATPDAVATSGAGEPVQTGVAPVAEMAVSEDRWVHPDGPAPKEALVASPDTGPQSPPAPETAVAPHPAFTGPTSTPPEGPAAAPPVNEALAATPASAEQIGGVPDTGQVQVQGGMASEAAGQTEARPGFGDRPAPRPGAAGGETPPER